jgi:hypothetical protein
LNRRRSEASQFGIRRRHRHSRREPGKGVQLSAAIDRRPHIVWQIEWQPHVRAGRLGEARRHDADDRMRVAVETQSAPQDVRRAGERAPPQRVADYGHRVRARAFVVRLKEPAQRRPHLHHVEEVRGGARALQPARVVLVFPVDVDGQRGADRLKRAHGFLQELVVWIRVGKVDATTARQFLRRAHQRNLGRLRDAELREEECFQDRKHRCVCPEGERHRDDNDHEGRAASHEEPAGRGEIEEQRVHARGV